MSEQKSAEETQSFYNVHSFEAPKAFKNVQINRFKKLGVEFPKTGKVLDVGTGSGRSAYAIHRINPNLDITVLDIAEKSLARITGFKKVHASALDIPFPDESFDVVVSVGCLHHTPNAKKGFQECCRVLKKGGVLIVALYNAWTLYPLVYNITKHTPKFIQKLFPLPIVQDQFFTPHASFHSPQQVKRWFAENNIQFIKLLGTGYYPPFFPGQLCQFVYYYGKKE